MGLCLFPSFPRPVPERGHQSVAPLTFGGPDFPHHSTEVPPALRLRPQRLVHPHHFWPQNAATARRLYHGDGRAFNDKPDAPFRYDTRMASLFPRLRLGHQHAIASDCSPDKGCPESPGPTFFCCRASLGQRINTMFNLRARMILPAMTFPVCLLQRFCVLLCIHPALLHCFSLPL